MKQSETRDTANCGTDEHPFTAQLVPQRNGPKRVWSRPTVTVYGPLKFFTTGISFRPGDGLSNRT